LNQNTILSRKGTIISYLALLERLFRTKQTKKEPACSVVEQAGVRYIELSRDWGSERGDSEGRRPL